MRVLSLAPNRDGDVTTRDTDRRERYSRQAPCSALVAGGSRSEEVAARLRETLLHQASILTGLRPPPLEQYFLFNLSCCLQRAEDLGIDAWLLSFHVNVKRDPNKNNEKKFPSFTFIKVPVFQIIKVPVLPSIKVPVFPFLQQQHAGDLCQLLYPSAAVTLRGLIARGS